MLPVACRYSRPQFRYGIDRQTPAAKINFREGLSDKHWSIIFSLALLSGVVSRPLLKQWPAVEGLGLPLRSLGTIFPTVLISFTIMSPEYGLSMRPPCYCRSHNPASYFFHASVTKRSSRSCLPFIHFE